MAEGRAGALEDYATAAFSVSGVKQDISLEDWKGGWASIVGGFCVAGSRHLKCRHALRLDIGKNDHRAAGKHQPQNQLEDLGQKVFAPGILHSKAAHCRAQHKAAAAKKSEQHIVQGLPCRISLHKGQHHQQKACKQGAKPRRKPLFCAFFAKCRTPPPARKRLTA